jgi:hypothetical protein
VTGAIRSEALSRPIGCEASSQHTVITMDPHDPSVQSTLFPFAFSLASTGAIRLVGGRRQGRQLASAAVSIAFLGVVPIVLGLPAFPPGASLDKLPYIVGMGLFLGTLLDLRPPPKWASVLLIALWPALTLAWATAPEWRVPDETVLSKVGLLYLGAVAILLRVHRQRDGLAPSLMVFSAGLGLGGVALLAAAVSLAQLAFALAAAAAGFMLWNWPVVRYPFGNSALLAGAGSLPLLGAEAFLHTRASPVALAVILLVFFADALARPMAVRGGRARGPLYLTMLCLVPAVLAIGLAYAERRGVRILP